MVIAIVASAVLVRLPFEPELGVRILYITFFPAVLVGAWLGGWRGGAFATLLGGLAADYYFIPPIHSFRISGQEPLTSLCIYLFVAMCLSGIGELQRKAGSDMAKTARQLTEAFEREKLINRISDAMRGAADVQDILCTVLKELGEALNCDRSYYVEYDLTTDIAEITCDWMRPGLQSIAGPYHMTEHGVNTKAAYRSGQTRIVEDLSTIENPEDTPLTVSLLNHLGIRSIVRVPLSLADTKSVISVCMTDSPRKWTRDEIQLVETVASQTLSAVHMARLRDREHNIAQQLQDALQPQIPKLIGGLELAFYYRPALAEAGVGGDFADVYSGDDGSVYLAVGDLSGKGLKAASQVALVRHSLRAAILLSSSLLTAVESLHRMLLVHQMLTGFATLFVGRYDVESRNLQYVNCGQDSGLVLRSSDSTVVSLPPNSPILGGFIEGEFAISTATLCHGDIFALFTDGLIEAGPSRSAMLLQAGVERMLSECREMTSPRAIVDHMINKVDIYSGNTIHDDQCLLVGVVG